MYYHVLESASSSSLRFGTYAVSVVLHPAATCRALQRDGDPGVRGVTLVSKPAQHLHHTATTSPNFLPMQFLSAPRYALHSLCPAAFARTPRPLATCTLASLFSHFIPTRSFSPSRPFPSLPLSLCSFLDLSFFFSACVLTFRRLSGFPCRYHRDEVVYEDGSIT